MQPGPFGKNIGIELRTGCGGVDALVMGGQLIGARGCERLVLPASSPDYSPIEMTFSKVKAFLRRVGARTHEALQQAIGQALETVNAQDALGWFTHCSYQSAQASEL